MDKSFNLTTSPWIKVIDNNGNEKTVSIVDLFKNAKNYSSLAGDMRIQDLSILRLLLAILTTVYTRYDSNDEIYEWLEVNDKMLVEKVDEDYDEDDIQVPLLETWKSLYQDGEFSEALFEYLEVWQEKFDLFGEKPFYQVTMDEYNQLVLDKNKIDDKAKGNLSIKLWNRRISESNNKIAMFSPKSNSQKNLMTLDEFSRWLVTYQVFSGTPEKSWMKGEKDKVPLFAGWLYKMNPVYADGKNLFETLMLNLVLCDSDPESESESILCIQKPLWEYNSIIDYLERVNRNSRPNNISEIYTMPAKLLCVKWENENPIMFTSSIPVFSSENAKVEPMTTWREDPKNPDLHFPETRNKANFSEAMWRHFGSYVKTNESDNNWIPGIVSWLNLLKKEKVIDDNFIINLLTTSLISDGSAANAPLIEINDNMIINADVIFDENGDNQRWPEGIEDMVELTQQVGISYYSFVIELCKIRGLHQTDKEVSKKMTQEFYEALNEPFKDWLVSLSNNDNRDYKKREWKLKLYQIALSCVSKVMDSSSSRDIKGIVEKDNGKVTNIFTISNKFNAIIRKKLDVERMMNSEK